MLTPQALKQKQQRLLLLIIRLDWY
jgi:hypothetical protein